MRTVARVMTAVALLTWSGSCSCPADRGVAAGISADNQAAEAAIVDLELEVFAAEAAGDVERWLSCYTGNAVLLPPGEHAVVGTQAIRAWAAPFFERYDLHESSDEREVEVAGEWGFIRAHWTWTLQPKDGGEAATDSGKSIWIVRRQPDGSWKIARAIWNSDPAG